MGRLSIQTVSEWIDGISALWKVGAVVALIVGATIGMIRATSPNAHTVVTSDSLLTVMQQHSKQTDSMLFELRALHHTAEAQLCVSTRPKSDWGDCIK